MGWRRVEIGPEGIARKLPEALRESFHEAFTRAGAPGNAALFEEREAEAVRFYFSPGAQPLFQRELAVLGSTRTTAPPKKSVLVEGNPKVWSGC